MLYVLQSGHITPLVWFTLKRMIYMKLWKLITIVLAVCLFVLPLSAFASAESLSKTYTGNTEDLIDIKNPEASATSTTNKACVVSAVAVPGTTVTLYKLDTESDKYIKLYSEDGKALEAVVGASGLYAQSLELKTGANNIMAVATNGSSTEVIKLEITLVKNNVADIIRNIWQSIIG